MLPQIHRVLDEKNCSLWNCSYRNYFTHRTREVQVGSSLKRH
ncbi:MAG TPA: hypothetical protein VM821_04975 [Abditibacteriaceae bacterium]|nr:hypothetical protein [Abditibacteriaceae bacterium]